MSERDEALRQAFRVFNRGMLLAWRLDLGRFLNRPWLGGQIMVITHTGRTSGARYRTPVNYARYDGDVYCTAGFGRRTDWYRNVLAHPQVEVWLPGEQLGAPVGWWEATATPVPDDDPDRLPRLREVLVASGFAGRLDGFRPGMPDDALATLTENLPLVRIGLGAARTGDGGPGDLAAVWPLAATVLAPLAGRGLLRRRTR
ncbi:MAG: nitroreductase family deazaflavin-dependent oxidoreductase [Candidatus Nanopelagicales bacterium]